jgi:hypothetical protein
MRILREQRDARVYELFEGRKLSADLTVEREVRIPKNETITREMLAGVEPKALRKAQLAGARATDVLAEVEGLRGAHRAPDRILTDIYEEKIAKLEQGDELRPASSRWSRSSSR